MTDTRTPSQLPDQNWDLAKARQKDGGFEPQLVAIAVLMDIRSELRKLNKTLSEASIFVNGKVG